MTSTDPAAAGDAGVPDASAAARVDRRWSDPSRPLDERVEALLSEMTLEEKLAQLGSVWLGVEDPGDEAVRNQSLGYEELSRHGLGHLTRVFGTGPVDPADGVRRLVELQQGLLDRTRLGVPAIAHEECLTGFTTYGASVFPTPLACAATFDADAV